MVCKEVKSSKYQTRRSSAFHAKDCKGLVKKGKNGNYISKPDSKGTYKWVKQSQGSTRKNSGKHYDIHDNGGRPFRVFIDGKNVSIYKNINKDFDKESDYSKLIKELKVKEIYIGKSTGLAAGADHSSAQAKQFIGNSILLHVSSNKYIHIGVEIYEFKIDGKVENYFSMVGNNDSPYPVVLGDKNVYFLLDNDHKYVAREHFPAKLINARWEDAYSMYYGRIDPITGENIKDIKKSETIEAKHAKKMKGFHMIQRR